MAARGLLRPGAAWGAAVLAAALGALGGCGVLGDRAPEAGDLREAAREAEASGYTYGYGTGDTPEEARQAALYEIAGEVVTAVRGEQREVFRSLERRGEARARDAERMVERELTATVASTSHVILEGASVVGERQVAEGWFVQVRIDDRRLAELRERARRQAPALAQVELLEAMPEPEIGRRFAQAGRGLETVERLGLGDERLYLPDRGETTFDAYLRSVAREAAGRLELIPLRDGDELRFVAVDGESLRPQEELRLRVGGRELRTGGDGRTETLSAGRWARSVDVEMLGARGQRVPFGTGERFAGSVSPEAWAPAERATLYVHTRPAGAVIEVDGEEYVAPARVPVASGAEHRIRVYGTEEHRSKQVRVAVPEGSPAAYRSLALDERETGTLELSARGRDTVVRLESHDGREREAVERTAEVGRYRVRVTRDDERYQDVVDTFVLRPDERVRREYRAPRYRYPYHYGWRLGISLAAVGGGPHSGFRVPADSGRVDFGDRVAGIEAVDSLDRDSELAAQLGIQGQYFMDALPLTGVGELSYRIDSFEAEQEREVTDLSTDEIDLETLQVAVGAGVWHPVGGGQGWLTGNLAWASSRWDDDNAAISMPGGRASNTYPFIELGGHWGGWLVTARVSDGDRGLRPMLTIGFGHAHMERGYRYPAEVEARPGVHFD